MNRDFMKLHQVLEPLGLDATALLRNLSREPALLAQPTRLEWELPGVIACCVSRCGLDADGRRYFLEPYELAEDEALDIHYLTVDGSVYTFADLWQGPWQTPAAGAVPVETPAETPTAA